MFFVLQYLCTILWRKEMTVWAQLTCLTSVAGKNIRALTTATSVYRQSPIILTCPLSARVWVNSGGNHTLLNINDYWEHWYLCLWRKWCARGEYRYWFNGVLANFSLTIHRSMHTGILLLRHKKHVTISWLTYFCVCSVRAFYVQWNVHRHWNDAKRPALDFCRYYIHSHLTFLAPSVVIYDLIILEWCKKCDARVRECCAENNEPTYCHTIRTWQGRNVGPWLRHIESSHTLHPQSRIGNHHVLCGL